MTQTNMGKVRTTTATATLTRCRVWLHVALFGILRSSHVIIHTILHNKSYLLRADNEKDTCTHGLPLISVQTKHSILFSLLRFEMQYSYIASESDPHSYKSHKVISNKAQEKPRALFVTD